MDEVKTAPRIQSGAAMDRKIKKKRFTPKIIAGYTVGAAFVFLVMYYIIFGDKSSKLNVESEKITIADVTNGEFQEFIPVNGAVIPLKTIFLDAIEGGVVEEKYIEEGTIVKEGDKLFKLGNTSLQLDIMQREAEVFRQINSLRDTRLSMEQNKLNLLGQLLDLQNQINQRKRDFELTAKLVNSNLASQKDFEDIKDQYEFLMKRRDLTILNYQQDSLFRKSQIEQLEASVDRMRNNLTFVKQIQEKLTIRAPIAGHLTSLNIEIGESKSRGERLGQIDVLNGFKVRAGIDEHYIARINIGQTGEFDFAGETYKLVIKKVYPEVLNGRFEVDLVFEGTEPTGIRRGQTVHIRLQLGDLSKQILLPRGGFYQKTGGQWIFVVDPSGDFAIKRNIRLGRQNPQVFEVLEGLEPGEKVIVSSYDNYGDIDKLVLKQKD